MTEAGYVGEDVEICLQRLLDAAGDDLELAQKEVVYLDEIDKIARAGGNRSITRDISGEGVQSSLLKLMEGCEVSVTIKSNNPRWRRLPLTLPMCYLYVEGHLKVYLMNPKIKLLDLALLQKTGARGLRTILEEDVKNLVSMNFRLS